MLLYKNIPYTLYVLGTIKIFNQNVDPDVSEEIVSMAYDQGTIFNLHITKYFTISRIRLK